ncbi:MAG: hypothetical protein KF858_01620 [Candidatus Sumerlaeia bacterium]|nr:hypothetical protein [Candidatus Sumerlaeia bacterium]
MAGLVFLFAAVERVRQSELLLPMLRRFWGPRAGVGFTLFMLGMMAYSIILSEAMRWLFRTMMFAPGGPGMLLRVTSFASNLISPDFLAALLLGLLLRRLLHSRFYREELRATPIDAATTAALALLLVLSGLLAVWLGLQLGYALWAGVEHRRPLEMFYALAPHARRAPFGEFSQGEVFLLTLWDWSFRMAYFLKSYLLIPFVIVWVRRLPLAVLAGWAAFFGLSLVTLPVDWLLSQLHVPSMRQGPPWGAVIRAVMSVGVFVTSLVVLGAALQFLRARLLPALIARSTE